MNLYPVFFFALLLSAVPAQLALAAEAGTGEKFYLKYCSSCHGKAGKGDGPVASVMKATVPDLTLLKQRTGGLYPLDYVMSTIDGRRMVRAHGERDMPVWGEIFREEVAKDKYKELTTLLTAREIAEYVGTLQR
jgi:mono/diheme cytochrome c family protein